VIIIANGKTKGFLQRSDDTEALWVRLGELPEATGWQMKPQGACLGELCVPLPKSKREDWIADADDRVWFNYSEFADATRDWIERGADSEHVWSTSELAERLKPVDDDKLLAEATFKLALHFEATDDSERAQKHFTKAQELAPDNWNYQRQGWNHKGAAYAAFKVLKQTSNLRKNTDKSFYDPTGLPGENHRRFTQPEMLWTPAVNRIKQLLRR